MVFWVALAEKLQIKWEAVSGTRTLFPDAQVCTINHFSLAWEGRYIGVVFLRFWMFTYNTTSDGLWRVLLAFSKEP